MGSMQELANVLLTTIVVFGEVLVLIVLGCLMLKAIEWGLYSPSKDERILKLEIHKQHLLNVAEGKTSTPAAGQPTVKFDFKMSGNTR